MALLTDARILPIISRRNWTFSGDQCKVAPKFTECLVFVSATILFKSVWWLPSSHLLQTEITFTVNLRRKTFILCRVKKKERFMIFYPGIILTKLKKLKENHSHFQHTTTTLNDNQLLFSLLAHFKGERLLYLHILLTLISPLFYRIKKMSNKPTDCQIFCHHRL